MSQLSSSHSARVCHIFLSTFPFNLFSPPSIVFLRSRTGCALFYNLNFSPPFNLGRIVECIKGYEREFKFTRREKQRHQNGELKGTPPDSAPGSDKKWVKGNNRKVYKFPMPQVPSAVVLITNVVRHSEVFASSAIVKHLHVIPLLIY